MDDVDLEERKKVVAKLLGFPENITIAELAEGISLEPKTLNKAEMEDVLRDIPDINFLNELKIVKIDELRTEDLNKIKRDIPKVDKPYDKFSFWIAFNNTCRDNSMGKTSSLFLALYKNKLVGFSGCFNNLIQEIRTHPDYKHTNKRKGKRIGFLLLRKLLAGMKKDGFNEHHDSVIIPEGKKLFDYNTEIRTRAKHKVI